MKILNRYIIKEHIGPFLFSVSVLMFILMMQFLVQHIDTIFGRGLSAYIVIKLIVLNLAWMLALAVPMATLVAVLMVYGSMSANNEITILKSSGISIYRLILPSFLVGIFLTIAMISFNDDILPDANHQAALTIRAIRKTKPTLYLEANIFYALGNYTLLVNKIEKPAVEEWHNLSNLLGAEYRITEHLDRLKNITIFDRSDPKKNITITADEGYMIYSPVRKSLVFTLFNGEFHEIEEAKFKEYQKSYFKKHMVNIPAPNFEMEEQNSNYRSDREMSIAMMKKEVAKAEKRRISSIQNISKNLHKNFAKIDELIAQSDSLVTQLSVSEILNKRLRKSKWDRAVSNASHEAMRHYQRMRTLQSNIDNHKRTTNKYWVEIHKKISLPFACLVFILIGAPLGIMAKKGNMGTAIALSLGFFILYWAFLMGGENLADRKFMTPFAAMWTPNIIVGIGGIFLIWRAVKETKFINWDFVISFFKNLKGHKNNV
jgi:lipopolysaccharide export system permease protein